MTEQNETIYKVLRFLNESRDNHEITENIIRNKFGVSDSVWRLILRNHFMNNARNKDSVIVYRISAIGETELSSLQSEYNLLENLRVSKESLRVSAESMKLSKLSTKVSIGVSIVTVVVLIVQIVLSLMHQYQQKSLIQEQNSILELQLQQSRKTSNIFLTNEMFSTKIDSVSIDSLSNENRGW